MSKSDFFSTQDQYATVADRIALFYSRYPDGRISTELVSRTDGEITFKALVFRSGAKHWLLPRAGHRSAKGTAM